MLPKFDHDGHDYENRAPLEQRFNEILDYAKSLHRKGRRRFQLMKAVNAKTRELLKDELEGESFSASEQAEEIRHLVDENE